MPSLTIQDIGLPQRQLRAVERRAKSAGQTAPQYIRSLIERDLMAEQPFDELLRPVHQDFRKRGVTPEQLDAMITRAAARAKRPVRK